VADAVLFLMMNGSVSGELVVIKHEIAVTAHFASVVLHEHAGIEIEPAAIGDARIPAKPDANCLEAGGFFAQADVAALRK